MKKILLAAVLTLGLTGCFDTLNITDNPISYGPTDDHMQERVRVSIPTAVLSSFDETSMGAALVRRLPNTSSEIQPDTKMVLIKGEDIMSRPFTEWLQTAKIYLKGGYIAIEKPHDAHLVHFMEQLADKMAQAHQELLTEDGRTTIIPSDVAVAASSRSAYAQRLQTRLQNIQACANTRGESDAQPVAEMVIFARDRYYQCAPHQSHTISVGSRDGNGEHKSTTKTIDIVSTNNSSGLLADGAARWLNNQQGRKANARAMTRADGEGAINELMSADEEHTYQSGLTALVSSDNCYIYDTKPNAYQEIYRVWGVHNMETNKDYYLIQQDITAAIGGQQEGDDRFDTTKTLYQGPYEEDEWIKLEDYDNRVFHDDDYEEIDHFYGSWFDGGEYAMNISGKGEPFVEEAIPQTDNNNVSTSVAVGETHSETNTIGASISAIISASPGVNIGANYSHGWTDGTSFTMTTTENAKELKCVKNTDGTKVQWTYSCGKDMMDRGDDDHPLAPDILTNDVDIQNQICWSVANPEGDYTVDIRHLRTMACLVNYEHDDKFISTCRADNEQELTMSFKLAVPNRATQTWYMDVTFPELGQEGHEGQKGQLTDYIKPQFPGLYQSEMHLADISDVSETTISNVVAMSKQLLDDPNASKTMSEYAKDLRISEYTLKWYTTDGKHTTFVHTVPAE